MSSCGTKLNLKHLFIQNFSYSDGPEGSERIKIADDDSEEHVRNWRNWSDGKRVVDKGEKRKPDEWKLRRVKSGQIKPCNNGKFILKSGLKLTFSQ